MSNINNEQILQNYINTINEKLQNATELTLRTAFENLLNSILEKKTYKIIGESKGILSQKDEKGNKTNIGRPDYEVLEKSTSLRIFNIETKSLSTILSDVVKTNQIKGYLEFLPFLIVTNYTEFYFYESNKLVFDVKIADLKSNKYALDKQAIDKFVNYLIDYAQRTRDVQADIKSSELASKLAIICRLIRDETKHLADEYKLSEKHMSSGLVRQSRKALQEDPVHNTLNEIHTKFLHNFKDLTHDEFADMFAQTVLFGYFLGYLNFYEESRDFDLNDRKKFAKFIKDCAIAEVPQELRIIKDVLANSNYLSETMTWVLNELHNLLYRVKLDAVMEEYSTNKNNGIDIKSPHIHFYEDFLEQYDKEQRKSFGAWYTPNYVVDYIVTSIDDILKEDFGIVNGLADDTIITKTIIDKLKSSKEIKREVECNKVTILDPATGTGTFLRATIEKMYKNIVTGDINKKDSEIMKWEKFVQESLYKKIYGFEIMGSPYIQTHIILSSYISSTIQDENLRLKLKKRRLGVYLTDSLEMQNLGSDENDIAGNPFELENILASDVKTEKSIMVVLGNPPYNSESKNDSKFIIDLVDKYKENLDNEQNIKNLNDDYIKFIRLAESRIEQNGEGIVGFITNNSYLDGVIHRTMRKHLMTTFDDIYIVNLHGNSRRGLNTDNAKDKSVFGIMIGVAIIVMVKHKSSKKDTCNIYYKDTIGSIEQKASELQRVINGNLTASSVKYKTDEQFIKLKPQEPYYFFIPQNNTIASEYNKNSFNINNILTNSNTGIRTHNDNFAIHYKKETCKKIIEFVAKNKDNASLLIKEYEHLSVNKEPSRDWTMEQAVNKISSGATYPQKIAYRAFDTRYCLYSDKGKGATAYPVYSIMQHMIELNNIGLSWKRQAPTLHEFNHALVTIDAMDFHYTESGNTSLSPLYLKVDLHFDKHGNQTDTMVNLNSEIVKEFEAKLGLPYDEAGYNYFNDNRKSEAEYVTKLLNFDNTNEEIVCTIDYSNIIKKDSFNEIDIFDYIYGKLWEKEYRTKFSDLLKQDYPRVPYPTEVNNFWQTVSYGKALRLLHTIDNTLLEYLKTKFDNVTFKFVDASNKNLIVDKKCVTYNKTEKSIPVNTNLYFTGITQAMYDFKIGSYEVLKKWLTNRQDIELTLEDLEYFMQICIIAHVTTTLTK